MPVSYKISFLAEFQARDLRVLLLRQSALYLEFSFYSKG